jgi:GNAT superfamily N-acetyltransferase
MSRSEKVASKMGVQIDFHLDYELPISVRSSLQALLAECFPEYLSDRLYYKQVPHGRLLALKDGRLVGQVGIDYRVVRIGDQVLRTFGVVDLCVASEVQGHGIGRQLLEVLEARARHGEVDVLMAIADDPRLYAAGGFRRINPTTRWLAIEDRTSIHLVEKDLGGCMLIKMVRKRQPLVENCGSVDLLGYLF